MVSPAASSWQDSLRQEMSALGRSGNGRFADRSDPRFGFVPVTRLLEEPYLRGLIQRAGGTEGVADGRARAAMDLTIAVSRFARQYCGAVSAAALIGLAHGVGIDMSMRHCSVTLTNIDLPVTRRRFVTAIELTAAQVVRCAARPTSLPVTGPVVACVEDLREYVWSRLFGANYHRLFAVVRAVAPTVSPALLWTSAAEYVGALRDAAEQHLTAAAAAPYVADCRALLEDETLPGVAGPNPLRGRLCWQAAGPDAPRGVLTRQVCCLNYLLPERDGLLCQNCPHLPPADRLALAEERSSTPGASGGPAQRKAQEVGRNRPSYLQRHGLREARP